ncbi:phage tail length tape measure family protein [Xanthobacter aminoxidans]|uniref:Phage tail length tape measure family protein n=1 Tax=Xanthobacter aminoxidans TaxID=186280 RepID=A0ABW6ZA12_9HYPH
MTTEINELRIEAKTESLARAESDLNKVADAQQRVAASGEVMATATDKAIRRQVDASVALDRLRKTVDDAYKAQQAFAAGQRTLDRNLAQGNLSQQDHARLLDMLRVKYGVAQTANDNFSQSAAKGTKLTANEMTNLGYQLNDVATSLASGASPFMVMAQQGGQVYQVLAGSQAGVVGSIKQLGTGLLGLLTPARLVTAGVAGIAVAAALAYSSYSAGERQLTNSLQGLGRSTDATVAQLETIVSVSASASRISVSSARDLTASFASTGKIGTEVFTGLIDVTNRYATLTGADLADAGKEMAQAFRDPAKGAVDLNQKLNFLDVATLKYIQDLEYSGQKTKAQQALTDALNKNLPAATANVTKLGWAWREVANFATGAYDAMGKAVSSAFKGPSLDQQIAALEKQVAAERVAAAGPKGRTQGVAAANLIRDEAELNKKYQERARLAAEVAAADARSASMAAQQVAEGRDPRFEQLRQLREQQALLNKATDGGTKGTQEQRDALEGVKNEIAALSANGTTLISVQEKLRRERELELAVTRATTTAGKIEAQAALDAFRAKAAGATNAVAAAQAEDTKIKALAEVYAQLSQAARQRLDTADETIAQQGLEAQLIGKTAGETALLRANFQTYWDLRKEEIQTGVKASEAEADALRKKNEELARSTQLTAELKLQDEIAFQRAQLGRSSQDQAIASTLRSSGVAVDLNSADSAALRLNATLSDMSTTADSALSGFIQDLRNGKSLTDALTNAMNKLLDKLIEMASNQAISSLMSGLFGISGLGGGGSLGTVGTTTGAVYVAGAHSGGVLGAGEATFVRADHPGLYSGAPRYHTGRDPFGLLAGEERAIIKKDEGIFTPAQMRALGARMGGGDTIAPVFAPVINMGAAGQGGGGVSPQELIVTLQQWWKTQRADVLNVVRDARSRRVPGV